MALSVCLVTRNEEQSLPRVLKSVAGLADEVVVADTGSTDRTVALAQQHGARVLPFAWDDDFAAGRNFALDQATGDWVLWLNPDEELLSASHDLVRQSVARDDAFAYGVVVQELLQPEAQAPLPTSLQVRLFRRRPEVHYL